MGCCMSKKNVPDVEANIEVKGNKCFNLKRMLCCDCDDDNCLSVCKSSCCVVNNITNNTFESPESQKRQLKKSHTI